jgi:hypothetical protein
MSFIGGRTEYNKLLSSPQWIARRNEIVSVSNSRCELCDKSDNGIEVHHRYYVLNRLPWEYPDDCFMVLCSSCHSAYHKLKDVPVLTEKLFIEKHPFRSLRFGSDERAEYFLFFFKDENKGYLMQIGKVPFAFIPNIRLVDANATIGQLINNLKVMSIRFPSMPGTFYTKYLSREIREYYIEGWSKEDFLSVQKIKSKAPIDISGRSFIQDERESAAEQKNQILPDVIIGIDEANSNRIFIKEVEAFKDHHKKVFKYGDNLRLSPFNSPKDIIESCVVIDSLNFYLTPKRHRRCIKVNNSYFIVLDQAAVLKKYYSLQEFSVTKDIIDAQNNIVLRNGETMIFAV